MDKSCFLQAKFDELTDSFDENDAISVENANTVMHSCFLDFLNAGFDVNQIVKMLSPRDVWDNYSLLTSHGVKINLPRYLARNDFDIDFVEKNWDKFVERGISIDALAEYCYSSIRSDHEAEELLKKGVSFENVLKLSEEAIEYLSDSPKQLAELFAILHEHGLSSEAINKILESHINGVILNSIIQEETDLWSKIGVNTSDYEELWLDWFGEDYIDDLDNLPMSIDANKLIKPLPLMRLLSSISCFFLDYIAYFVYSGGNVDEIKKKFGDISQLNNSEEIEALLDLLIYDPRSFDIEDVIAKVDFSKLTKEAKEFYAWDEEDEDEIKLVLDERIIEAIKKS